MMDASKTLFIDIDTQNDFCRGAGSLYVPAAPVEAFRRLAALAVKRGIPIVGSVDAHEFDDAEFETFPAHCVKGTWGQMKIDGTVPKRSRFVPLSTSNRLVGYPLRGCQAMFFEKVTFSIFDNPSAARLLEAHKDHTFVVYGVATDYCVKAAVLGLCELGAKVVVVSDAIAGVTPETTATATTEMKVAGVQFVTEAELTEALAAEAA